MRSLILAALLIFFASGCASPPRPPVPVDPAAGLLETGEAVRLRVPANLMHGHDMTVPPYDQPEGYRPIPAYAGELLLTDRRLLFVSGASGPKPSWYSISYGSIARSRPSQTPLLHYIVVWNAEGHADSFVVRAEVVRSLHRTFGEAMMARGRVQPSPATSGHRVP